MQMIMDSLTPEALETRKKMDEAFASMTDMLRKPDVDCDRVNAENLSDSLRRRADAIEEARERAAFAKRKVIA